MSLVQATLRHRAVIVGTGLGLVGAYWVANLVSHLLYGIDGHDPLTFASVAVLALLVCAIAAYVPARRALSISPMKVMASD